MFRIREKKGRGRDWSDPWNRTGAKARRNAREEIEPPHEVEQKGFFLHLKKKARSKRVGIAAVQHVEHDPSCV